MAVMTRLCMHILLSRKILGRSQRTILVVDPLVNAGSIYSVGLQVYLSANQKWWFHKNAQKMGQRVTEAIKIRKMWRRQRKDEVGGRRRINTGKQTSQIKI